MTLGFGLGQVAPKNGNGILADMPASVGENARPIVTFEYFLRDNLGIEVLGALPFKHNISLGDLGQVGQTKHLPPTISINWHIPTQTAFTPFIGLGLNYTKFFEESSKVGALKIKDSFGLAATLGVDYALSKTTSLRADLRYINIDSKVMLDGNYIGKVKIDPVVTSVSYVIKF